LQALPRDVFEAAAADGASSLETLWRITLPLLLPAIVFAGIFRAIDAFRSFDIVYGLTYGGPGRLTTTLSFYGWENGQRFARYGFSSAISYVMVIVAILMVTLLFRYLRVRREDAT
jgi:multiple sugar transport system permease protein